MMQIVHLNTDLERLNLEQQRLDHELDFVSGQQRELSDILTPLESALESMPDISYQQHADLERESTCVWASGCCIAGIWLV